MALNGGRCAARVVQRKFVKGGGKQGPRVMPTRYLRSGSNPAKETVSAGACSDWQTWQTVSGPP